MDKILPKIVLGAWSWGIGKAGGDQVFGNYLSADDLKPVFKKAMEHGLCLWDTAAVYGEGSSERILGNFVKEVSREKVILSTKFTPQIASASPDAMQEILAEIKRANEILAAEGLKISAVQNHFSLLHRSSERAGILDYCKENGITFYSYMVLEQGALTGRNTEENPFPAGTGRGDETGISTLREWKKEM